MSGPLLKRPLETERLLIRRFEPNDWQAVYAYTRRAKVMEFIEESALTEKQTKKFVKKNAGDDAIAYPVILKSNDKLIGHMIFHPWYVPRMLEIGWVIHPAFHNKGYATEAAQALLEYSFRKLKAHRVLAICQPENPASYRVMEKLGMRREAHFRKFVDRGNNEWWDEYLYAILEEEWFARHPE